NQRAVRNQVHGAGAVDELGTIRMEATEGRERGTVIDVGTRVGWRITVEGIPGGVDGEPTTRHLRGVIAVGDAVQADVTPLERTGPVLNVAVLGRLARLGTLSGAM